MKLAFAKALAINFENDSRRIGGPGSDQSYTNGFRVSYLGDSKNERWGYLFGHQLYTPNQTDAFNDIATDQPYVAWLYAGVSKYEITESDSTSYEFDFGTVGPSALGAQVQNHFHDLIHDELTLELTYHHRQIGFKHPLFDLIPFYGASAGNVRTSAQTGIMLRVGPDLPMNFGPTRPSAFEGDLVEDPHPKTGTGFKYFYGFASARLNLVFRNIFLDGNTFTPSTHVKKDPITYETEFGYGVSFSHYDFLWRFVTKSPEFEQQSKMSSFASISFVDHL